MKRILAIILLLAMPVWGQTTYYVRTTGTDGAGNTGLTDDPWATPWYAEGRITAGDTVKIGDGTYEHASRWELTYDWASETFFEAETAGSVLVKITGAQANHNTWINGTCSNYTFRDIYFDHRADTQDYAFSVWTSGYAYNMNFYDCTFSAPNGGANTMGFMMVVGNSSGDAGNDIFDWTFDGCTFLRDAGTAANEFAVRIYQGGGTIANLSFINCTVTSTGRGLVIEDNTDTVVRGGTFTAANLALAVGSDGGGDTGTGRYLVENITVTGTGSHALLVADGADNSIVRNCTSDASGGSDYAMVIKSTAGVEVYGCRLIDGSSSTLLLKQQTTVSIHDNVITNAGASNDIISHDATATTLAHTIYNNYLGGGQRSIYLREITGVTFDIWNNICETASVESMFMFADGGAPDINGGNNVVWQAVDSSVSDYDYDHTTDTVKSGDVFANDFIPRSGGVCDAGGTALATYRPGVGQLDFYGRPKLRPYADVAGAVYPQRPDRRNLLKPLVQQGSDLVGPNPWK